MNEQTIAECLGILPEDAEGILEWDTECWKLVDEHKPADLDRSAFRAVVVAEYQKLFGSDSLKIRRQKRR